MFDSRLTVVKAGMAGQHITSSFESITVGGARVRPSLGRAITVFCYGQNRRQAQRKRRFRKRANSGIAAKGKKR
jgi:hypothetical protein